MPTHSKFSTAPSPPPRVSAHSQQVHVCPFTPPPPPGHLTEPPLRGTHSPSFTRTPVSHPISVITRSSGRLVPLRQIQSPISRAAFLVTLTACLPTPPQTTKAPSGPAPPGFAWVLTPLRPGPSLSRPLLQGLQESHHPGQAVCCPGEAPWCQVGPPTLSTVATPASRPLPSGWAQGELRAPLRAGSHLIVALPAGELFCACCTGAAHSHTPPRSTGFCWAGSSKGMGLTWAGTRRAQYPGTQYRALIAEHPQPTCWLGLTLSPSEQDLN